MPLPGAERIRRLLRPALTVLPRLEFHPSERRTTPRIALERDAVLRWREQFEQRVLEVRLLDRSPEGMGISLGQQLPLGLLARLRWEGGEPIQAVVLHCSRLDGRFVAGLRHLPKERRGASRQPLHESAELVWDELIEGRVISRVHLRDVSSRGLCCDSPRIVPVPLVVCLTARDWHYYGSTRYCAKSEAASYSVGIQLVHIEPSAQPGLLP